MLSATLALTLPAAALAGGPAQEDANLISEASAPRRLYAPLGGLVNFDTWIGTLTALGVTETSKMTVSWWAFGTINNANDTHALGGGLMGNDPGGLTSRCEENGVDVSPGLCLTFDTSPHNALLSFNGPNGLTDPVLISATGSPAVMQNGRWNHYLASIDTVKGLAAVAVNGLCCTAFTRGIPASGYLPEMNNSKGFGVGYTSTKGGGATGFLGIAEVYISEQSNVCSGAKRPSVMNGVKVTCLAANTIPPEIIAKFFKIASVDGSTGLPVDLGPTCAEPTGTPPAAVCLTGSASGMLTNRAAVGGTFGIFTHTGTTSPGPKQWFDMPYGPAGIPPHQATMRWIQSRKNAPVSGGTMTTDAASMPVAIGDLIVIWAEEGNNTGSASYDMKCPGGFTQVGPGIEGAASSNSEMCYKILAGGDTSGAYTVRWREGGGQRTHGWAMADYANVAAVDQAGFNTTGAVTNPNTASRVTQAANETVVSALVSWDAQPVTFTPPGSATTRLRVPRTGDYGQIMVTDEYRVPKGSKTARTFTLSATNHAQTGYTLSLTPK